MLIRLCGVAPPPAKMDDPKEENNPNNSTHSPHTALKLHSDNSKSKESIAPTTWWRQQRQKRKNGGPITMSERERERDEKEAIEKMSKRWKEG